MNKNKELIWGEVLSKCLKDREAKVEDIETKRLYDHLTERAAGDSELESPIRGIKHAPVFGAIAYIKRWMKEDPNKIIRLDMCWFAEQIQLRPDMSNDETKQCLLGYFYWTDWEKSVKLTPDQAKMYNIVAEKLGWASRYDPDIPDAGSACDWHFVDHTKTEDMEMGMSATPMAYTNINGDMWLMNALETFIMWINPFGSGEVWTRDGKHSFIGLSDVGYVWDDLGLNQFPKEHA